MVMLWFTFVAFGPENLGFSNQTRLFFKLPIFREFRGVRRAEVLASSSLVDSGNTDEHALPAEVVKAK